MKFLKGRAGVIFKGIGSNIMRTWTQAMHRCAEVAEAVRNILPIETSQENHKEIFYARVKWDHKDFQIIQSWFKNCKPFTSGEQLIALDSGR